MQNLWSRAGPLSSSTCRCCSCLSSVSNAVASRSATAASRRRLRLGNSVTMFYSTVFATAMVLDADAKVKRRNEWEKKIGDIKEEVTAMRNEEVHKLENILSRRSKKARRSPVMHRRCYSTTTSLRFIPPENRQREMQPEEHGHNPGSAAAELRQSGSAQDYEEESNRDDDGCENANWASNDPLQTRALQRLATRQLALRFMLRPHLAHIYSGVSLKRRFDFNLPKPNVQGLLGELKLIRKRQKSIKRGFKVDDPLLQDLSWSRSSALREERRQLDDDLAYLLLRESKSISSEELILKVSDNLLATEEPISSSAMALLIQHFTRTRDNDLVTMILTTLLPSKILVSQSIIISTLNFYAKSRDLYAFEGFMRRLQGFGGTVNVPRQWETGKIGNVEIPVPPSPAHPFIYNNLISAAIKFEQIDKANAWFHYMHRTGQAADHSILGLFLRYYADRSDWENGAPFLSRALTYITSLEINKHGVIERLIVYMLILCDNCQKTQLFSNIISAAVESGFHWKPGYNESDASLLFERAIDRWRYEAEKSGSSSAFSQSIPEKCRWFGHKIREPLEMAISNKPNGQLKSNPTRPYTETKAFKSQARSMRRLRGELSVLREQVLELRKVVHRQATSPEFGRRQRVVTFRANSRRATAKGEVPKNTQPTGKRQEASHAYEATGSESAAVTPSDARPESSYQLGGFELPPAFKPADSKHTIRCKEAHASLKP